MNCLLRGIIGGLASGAAPRPPGAGSTRRPDGSGVLGGGLSADESARSLTVLLRAQRSCDAASASIKTAAS